VAFNKRTCAGPGRIDHVEAAWILRQRPIEAQVHAKDLHQQGAVGAVVGDDDDRAFGHRCCVRHLLQTAPHARRKIGKTFTLGKRHAVGRGGPQ
jgi:hypothetical protein